MKWKLVIFIAWAVTLIGVKLGHSIGFYALLINIPAGLIFGWALAQVGKDKYD